MCDRFTLTTNLDVNALASRFEAQTIIAKIQPRYNIEPTQRAAVVLTDRGRRVLDSLRWGLLPAWTRTREIASPLINARAETILERSVYRDAFIRRRCLIPSDGFYEWGRRDRTPCWIRLRDGAPAAYAGLFERRTERIGTELATFSRSSLLSRMSW